MNSAIRQSGNVLIIILATVALLGALIFTFTRSGQQGTGTFSTQQARIHAQDIIAYAKQLETGVDRVRRNNCSENQISFQASGNTGYVNGNTPGDNTCKIFEKAGGKTPFQPPASSWLVSSYSGNAHYGQWIFTSDNKVPNVGTDVNRTGNDIVAMLLFVPMEICIQINNLLNVPNVDGLPPAEGTNVSIGKYVGAFAAAPGALWDSNIGHPSACLSASDATPPSGSYFFFHTLLAR